MKVLITGGHLTAALAVIERWQKERDLEEIIFVGRKYINEFEKVLSFEYKEVTKKNIKFIPLKAGRFTRLLNWRSFINLFLIPIGFINAFKIIKKERPDVILSFGGYLALPVVFVGVLFGATIYTHEQTIHPGLANRIIGFFSKKIFVAFDEAKKYFPERKTFVIGNPIRKAILTCKKIPPLFLHIKKNRPVIYITGGSLGSHSINSHIKNILPMIIKKYIVIHQIGESKVYHDFEELKKYQNENYFPAKHFFDEEVAYIFKIADLVISRAGANIFFELLALKKPTIFIPLPWSAGKEQEHHAKIFKKAGAGEIFYQHEKSSRFLQLIDKIILDKEKYKKNFNQLTHLYRKNATEVIIREILSKK